MRPALLSAVLILMLFRHRNVRHHWDVENGLHLQKDKYYGEDKHVFRQTDLAEVWTVLTNIGLSLARLYHKEERTLREVREQFLANPQNALK